MKNLDLEKVIILLSLLLMPVAGGWIWMLRRDLDAADASLRTYQRTVKDVYVLQDQIDLTAREFKDLGPADDYSLYFERRLDGSIEGDSIKQEHLRPTHKTVVVKRGSTRVGEDVSVSLELRKGSKDMPVSREFINAFLFNSEMKTPIWKLRHLQITNEDFKKMRRQKKVAPKVEFDDVWIINKLVFARRKPLEVAAK